MLTYLKEVDELTPHRFVVIRWIGGQNTVLCLDPAPAPPEIIGDSEDWLTAGLPQTTPCSEIGGQRYGLGAGEV